jgi:uncharacterized protein with von Willebrand factor type A (vWA) domain
VTAPGAGGHLLQNLLLFARVLRGLGLDGSPATMIDLAAALGEIDLGHKSDVYHAMRALVVRRHEEIALFDEAFETFWRKPAESWTSLDLRAMGERRRFRQSRFAPAPLRSAGGSEPRSPSGPDETTLLQVTATYSPAEILRHKDFGEMTAEELVEVQRLLSTLTWSLGARRTRRRRAGLAGTPDLRRTLRRNLRHGGEILEWAHRTPRTKPRPLVVLADISGSMERYTRILLLWLYALVRGLEQQVEGFLFGTRLTRITRHLRGNDVQGALTAVARAVPDWSGGTRIGDSLRAFNFEWGRRVLGHGAVVLLVSDGWDRGEPDVLGREMARLQRNCHRLIWLNPLLGAPEYEPLTRGMLTALPYVDDFLPVHDLASLEDLARRLEAMEVHRPERRQHATVVRWSPSP